MLKSYFRLNCGIDSDIVANGGFKVNLIFHVIYGKYKLIFKELKVMPRPIEHLLGQPLLADGILQRYSDKTEHNARAYCITKVRLTDYPTGKILLAPVLQHCWVWAKEEDIGYIETLESMLGCGLNIGDKVLFAGYPSEYTRADGSLDFRLNLRSEISGYKQMRVRRGKFRRGLQNVVAEADLDNYRLLIALRERLDRRRVDWRNSSYSAKMMRADVLGAISDIRRRLVGEGYSLDFLDKVDAGLNEIISPKLRA